MKQEEFERALLRLWTSTRVPLTRANLLAVTEAPRAKLDGWMSALVTDGIAEIDSDDDGEVLWRVRGAERPKTGPRSVAEIHAWERLNREVGTTPQSSTATRLQARLLPRDDDDGAVGDEKSLVASGVLSFAFGPFGWLYAAPLKESIPAIAAMTVLAALLPTALFLPLFSATLPVFALAGVGYAHAYNRSGRRTPLLEKLAARALPPGAPRR
jgi:hypothetical protein